jgi:hypothetical protein
VLFGAKELLPRGLPECSGRLQGVAWCFGEVEDGCTKVTELLLLFACESPTPGAWLREKDPVADDMAEERAEHSAEGATESVHVEEALELPAVEAAISTFAAKDDATAAAAA